MACKNCGGELEKIRTRNFGKNRKKEIPQQELCVRCQLQKLGWKDGV